MNNDINNEDRGALLALLQVIRSNTEFYMRQQWVVTNYTFLLYGAIIGILNLKIVASKIGCLEKIIAFALSTLMCIAAVFLIIRLQNSLKANREMVGDIYDKIPVLKNLIKKSLPKTSLTWLFIVLLIIGDFSVLWLLTKI